MTIEQFIAKWQMTDKALQEEFERDIKELAAQIYDDIITSTAGRS